MNTGIVRGYDPNFWRNSQYRRLIYLEQFLLTLSWSLERTALVVHTLNDTDNDAIGLVDFAIIRIIWEASLVLGGWLVGSFVVWCQFTPMAMLKNCARLALVCTPLLFYSHVMQLAPRSIVAVYTLFYFVDGGIRNMRNVILTQCSPQREMMRTIGINLAFRSMAIMCGSCVSMLLFRLLDDAILTIHLVAAVAYTLSVFTLQMLGDSECAPPVIPVTETKSIYNPVRPDTAPVYLLLVFMLLPITYSVLSFYEIWAISEYDVSNATLDSSKLGMSLFSMILSLLCATTTSLWPFRRWIIVGAQALAIVAIGCIAYIPLEQYQFFVCITALVVCVLVSRLINSAMFFDYLPSDSQSLTKWASVSMLATLLTRFSELGMGALVNLHGYSSALTVTMMLVGLIVIVCVWVAQVLHTDMSPKPITIQEVTVTGAQI